MQDLAAALPSQTPNPDLPTASNTPALGEQPHPREHCLGLCLCIPACSTAQYSIASLLSCKRQVPQLLC